MHRSRTLIPSLLALLWVPLVAQASEGLRPDYPTTKRVAHIDRYHGVAVEDPYRWLEDQEAPETRSWAATQDRLMRSFVAANPARRSIHARVKELRATGDLFGVPRLGGGNYVYTANEPGWGAFVFRVRKGLNGTDRLLYDPNPELLEGESLSGYTVSSAGSYLGYRVTESLSRWGELRLLETESGRRGEALTGVLNANVAWLPDDSGFYYVYFGDSERLKAGETALTPEVRFHRVGRSQSKDVTILAAPDNPERLFSLRVVGRRPYLAVSSFDGTSAVNRVLFGALDDADDRGRVELRELVGDDSTGSHTVLGAEAGVFYVYSDEGAPNGRVVAMDATSPGRSNWREIVPEGEATIAGSSSAGGNAIAMIGRHLALVYRRGNQSWLRVHALDGRLEHEIELEAGWIGSGLIGGPGAEEVWYSFSGLLEPQTVFRLDLATGRNHRFFEGSTPVDRSAFVTRQVHYPSKDGTLVPLFVAHRRGLKLDGTAPAFIYGYGFGGWVAVPWYQPHMLTWMEMGGVYAVPGIRGGGEYGDAWEEAGIVLNRQNAIDDYIAAAEWLVEKSYTSKGKIAANGWSASGALAATAVLQRPDLYGAGVIGIPSLDLLRYQHFRPFKSWTGWFGSSDDPHEFEVLSKLSPYHNVETDVCYPPMIVTVGEKDDRTPPLHGYKFVARAQSAAECSGPALLQVVWGAGHIFGATPEQTSETWSDKLAFLSRVFQMKASSTSRAR